MAFAPALMATKGPRGGLDCPCSSLPQHSASPSRVIPQAWELPALIAEKALTGGVDTPQSLTPQPRPYLRT